MLSDKQIRIGWETDWIPTAQVNKGKAQQPLDTAVQDS